MKTRNIFIAFLLVAAAFLTTLTVRAQETDTPPTRKERIEQLKIAFITRELDLSSEEAEKFWPVYNEMTDVLRKEKRQRRKLTKELKEGADSMDEATIKKKTEAVLNSEIKQAEQRKIYTNKLADIIGYKKVVKLLSLEQRFKQELLKKVNQNQERRASDGSGRGRGH